MNQSILWLVLSKYDGKSEFIKFCDAISRLIQNNVSETDYITIYQHFGSLDKEDYNTINESIGDDINTYLFNL